MSENEINLRDVTEWLPRTDKVNIRSINYYNILNLKLSVGKI